MLERSFFNFEDPDRVFEIKKKLLPPTPFTKKTTPQTKFFNRFTKPITFFKSIFRIITALTFNSRSLIFVQ